MPITSRSSGHPPHLHFTLAFYNQCTTIHTGNFILDQVISRLSNLNDIGFAM